MHRFVAMSCVGWTLLAQQAVGLGDGGDEGGRVVQVEQEGCE